MQHLKENREGYIYPQFLCRVGGISADKMDMLRSKKLSGILRRFSNSYHLLVQVREKLTTDLYKQVSIQEDKLNRQRFLELRRSIYNLKKLNGKFTSGLSEILPGRTVNEILEYNFLIDEYFKTSKEITDHYNYEFKKVRKKFKEMVCENDFQKGLLLASDSLFNTQAKYLKSKDQAYDRKREQIERGLLRYFSRMSMKTTPFATLCSVVPGEIKDAGNLEDDQLIKFVGKIDEKKSQVFLTKHIFTAITRQIKKIESVRKFLKLTINPTILAQKNEFHFITVNNGREENRVIHTNYFLNIVRDFFLEKDEIKLKDLQTVLIGRNDLRITDLEVNAYLDKLINDGFLQLNVGTTLSDRNWIEILIKLLQDFDDQQAQLICSLLKDLKYLLEVYSRSETEERVEVLQNISTLIRNTFEDLGITFNPEALPIYEDSSSDSKVFISERKFQSLRDDILQYVRLTSKIAWPLKEQIKLRQFWDDYYRGEKKSVPLLQFYRDYYRRHFRGRQKEDLKSDAGGRNEVIYAFQMANTSGSGQFDELTDSVYQIQELIKNKWRFNRDAEEIDISFEDLAEILKNIPDRSLACSSVTLFSQLAMDNKEKGNTRLFLQNGNFLNGYGKYLSRLSDSKDTSTEMLVDSNDSLTEDIVAEISLDTEPYPSHFEDLLKWQIVYPGCENSKSDNKIVASDIFVELDQENELLKLRHKITGKYLYPTDLGFSNPKNRPPFYRFLNKFSTRSNFSLVLPDYCEDIMQEQILSGNQDKSTEQDLVYCPRISINKSIIISRKKWKVRPGAYPIIKSGESDADYFVRINKWRIENNIPEEVYIKIKTDNTQQETPAENRHYNKLIRRERVQANSKAEYKMSNYRTESYDQRDTYSRSNKKHQRELSKPQYIDFRNPLFVNLFGRLGMNQKNNLLVIEERYPDNSQLPEHHNKKFATELVLQFNFPEYIKFAESEDNSKFIDIMNA